MIYLTEIGQPPGGSRSVHIYTQTIQRTTQNKQYIAQHKNTQNKKYIEQHKNQEECGPCPVFAGFTLAFALQLRKKHGKTSVRVVRHKHTIRKYIAITIKIHKLHYQTGIKPYITETVQIKSLNAGFFESGQLSWYSYSLLAGRPGDRIPVEKRFSAPVKIRPRARPVSCKRPEHGVDHAITPPSSTEVKEGVELYLYSSLWAFVDCSRAKLTFLTL